MSASAKGTSSSAPSARSSKKRSADELSHADAAASSEEAPDSKPAAKASKDSSNESQDAEELPKVDLNFCPFELHVKEPTHNLVLTLRNRLTKKPHPFIKCSRCKKWRALPNNLSQLSPQLPSITLTVQSFNELPSSVIPFPFNCTQAHWDLDRRICSAIQDYTDIGYDWCDVPFRFVRTIQRFDFFIALSHFLRIKGVEVKEYPCIWSKPVDLFHLYTIVYQLGGDQLITQEKKWPIVYKLLKLTDTATKPADVDYLAEIYRSYFFEWQNTPILFSSVDNVNPQQGSDALSASTSSTSSSSSSSKRHQGEHD